MADHDYVAAGFDLFDKPVTGGNHSRNQKQAESRARCEAMFKLHIFT
jgi:hypothetical protein